MSKYFNDCPICGQKPDSVLFEATKLHYPLMQTRVASTLVTANFQCCEVSNVADCEGNMGGVSLEQILLFDTITMPSSNNCSRNGAMSHLEN